MTYANFPFYQDTYLGSQISEDDFPRLALRASQYLDYITQGRAKNSTHLEELGMACCALAEEYETIGRLKRLADASVQASLESGGRELQSETVGPWSKTFQSGGERTASAAAQAAQAEAQLFGIAQRYLAPTGLLYRGGRRCGCSPIP